MNTIQNRLDAGKQLRKAEKMAKTYEVLTADINSEIAKLHEIGLKSAVTELNRAKARVERVKELVRLRIKVLKAKSNLKR